MTDQIQKVLGGSTPAPNVFTIQDAPTRMPPATRTVGAPGFVLTGGYLLENEKDPRVSGLRKFRLYSDILANTAIVGASLRAFIALVGKPEWTVVPADDSAEALELAEFAEEVLFKDMITHWPQVVRRAALYRFYGFGVQEWTAKKRDDGRIGLLDIEPRPQTTVHRWDCDQHGNVIGVVQMAPATQREIYLPRQKLLYLVDDAINDSPEGLGLFRHIVKDADKLLRLELIESWGFESDIRGIPIVRAPLKELRELGTELEEAQLAPLRRILADHKRGPELGLMLESETFRSTGEGQTPSGVKRFDFELLRGDAGPHEEIAAAIERLNRQIARVMGTEHLLLGADSKGSHAMAQDKSQAFAELIDATLVDIRAQARKDLLEPVWDLNGLDRALMPTFRTSPLALSDVQETTEALVKMAQAGAPLMPNDPAVNKVRALIGLPDAPEVDLSLTAPLPGQGMLPGQAPPTPEEDMEGDGDEDQEVASEPEEKGA